MSGPTVTHPGRETDVHHAMGSLTLSSIERFANDLQMRPTALALALFSAMQEGRQIDVESYGKALNHS
jgi:hypothetical protein